MMIDDTTRTGIREKARALFRVAETILVMALLLTGLWLVNVRFGTDFMALEPLRDASVAFDQAATNWNAERVRDIALLPPPQDTTKLSDWADLVQAHVGYPAAVFIMRGTTAQGIRVSETLKTMLSKLPEFRNVTSPDNIADVAIRQGPLADTGIQVWLFSAAKDQTEWGVMSRLDDYLPEFAREALNWKRTPASRDVNKIVAVDNKTLPAMRVLLKGSLLGSTPALDTTLIHYAVTRGDLRTEYYLPLAQQILADHVRKPWFPWFLMVADIVLMAGVFVLHRWIRTLTETKQF
jgi:hypothetical protein